MKKLLVVIIYLFAISVSAAVDNLTYQYQSITIAGRAYQARIPNGFILEVLTTKLDRPRLFTFAENGDLFIGSKSGAVYRLPPPYTAVSVLVVLDNYPHSVAFRQNEILVARTDGLYHSPYRPGQSQLSKDSFSL
ncbi:MAG: sugar dehydrogenase, partial [Gammaproteobacteria bacterium]|nr:sugar dehydrogenase [Gammaproteobacteria bacterium]